MEINQLEEPEPLPNMTEALKRYYRDYFADWFEPNQQMNRLEGGGIRRSGVAAIYAKMGLQTYSIVLHLSSGAPPERRTSTRSLYYPR